MAILFGLGAALAYGAADFLGGLMTKRTSVLAVVLLSQAFGTILMVAAVPLVLKTPLDTGAMAWGAAAGVTGGAGVTLLYRGLARGQMSVVAPVTAVVAASIPVVVGLVQGERPGGVSLAGVALGLAAVALVSSPHEADRKPSSHTTIGRPNGLLEALGAGLCFGAFFIFLDVAGDDTGLWPLVGARGGSFAVITAAVVVLRPRMRPAPGSMVGIAGAGVLDVLANLLYLLASRRGLLSLVAVLTSLYPASTVVLARVVLHERLQRPQLVGLACAAVAALLIAAG